jgi:hypothetical protein
MSDAEIKPRLGIRSITQADMEVLFPFFDGPDIDYAGFKTAVDARFDTRNLIFAWNAFADNIRQVEEGRPPLVEMQAMVAKMVLSLMVEAGRIKAARQFLAAIVEKWDRERFIEADTMLNLCDTAIETLEVLDRPWRDYQVFDRKQKTTMVLFCGHAHRFGVELNQVALWLQSLPVNLVYLRDFNLRLYLAGVQSIGNIEASVARLKEDLAVLGTERLVTMGNSGGVYGALHYGDLLGADEVLCFAGPTSLSAGLAEAAERPVYEIISEEVKAGLLSEPDLRARYRENGVSVRYFYAADYAFDAAQVATLEGLPNVSIEPIADFGRHVVIGEMARRGMLRGVLERAATG